MAEITEKALTAAANAMMTDQFRRILTAAGMEWQDGHFVLAQSFAQAALQAAAPYLGPKWQSMESAPEFVDVLVWGPNGFGVYAVSGPHWREEWDDAPTHWMPLPTPPEGGKP